MKKFIAPTMFVVGMAIFMTALGLPIFMGEEGFIVGVLCFVGPALAIGSIQTHLVLSEKN